MKKVIKIIIEVVLGVAVLAVAAGVYKGCRKELAVTSSSMAAMATPVGVAEVQERLTSDRLEALGTGKAKESVEITASESEKIVGIFFEDGERVEAGKLLVQLEERLLQAERESAVATLADERREMERAKELLKKDGIAEKVLDSRATSLAKAEIALEAIDARLRMREVRAPFGGFLGLRRVSLGAYVTPGTVMTTLDDISELHVDFTVPEKYLVTLGTGVVFRTRTSAFPGMVITGMVTSVETRIDPVSLSAVVRGTVDNAEGKLRPGMLFTIDLEASPRRSLWVPEKALMSLGEIQYVFVPDAEEKAERREVRLGRREEGMVEVVKGLALGERVVTDGVGKLKDGMAVRIVDGREGGAQ